MASIVPLVRPDDDDRDRAVEWLERYYGPGVTYESPEARQQWDERIWADPARTVGY